MVVALPTAAARDDARPTEPGRRERDEQPEPATTEVNR
jgi:hypothetical protein